MTWGYNHADENWLLFMSHVDPPPASQSPPRASSAVLDKRRVPGAGRFVAVFALTVISLLVGYRYAINTRANDWYLFQVAGHTCWLLDVIGYRADLEKNTGSTLNPAEVRAMLRGKAAAKGEAATAESAAPLTPWEIWRYRAQKQRHNPNPSREIGPRILFVLTPGTQHRLEALENRLQALPEGDSGLAKDRATLKEQIQAIKKEMASGANTPAQRRARQGRFFSFIVIPECGAIEVMAIFLAAVIAFPAAWRIRAAGLIGLPVLYLVNIVRLACLAYIGALDASGQWFEFVHEYVWQAIYVIFVVLVWMAWVEFGVKRKTP